MRKTRSVGALLVAAAFIAMAFASVPSAAVDRSEGDFWTYDLTVDLMALGIDDLTGEIPLGSVNTTLGASVSFTYAGTDSVTVGGVGKEVNVMRISGGATQTVDFIGFELSLAVGGFIYELVDKPSIVKGHLFMWMNTSLGSGSFQIVNRTATELTVDFSPPLLSGFDPETTEPGDSWTEKVTVTASMTESVDGIIQGTPVNSTDILTYSLSVDSSRPVVTTEAGKFECLKITASGDDSEEGVFYWSDKARNFVRMEGLVLGSDDPFLTLSLKDYDTGSGLGTVLFIAAGGGLLVLALIVLAFVVMKRRKPVAPASYPEPPPPPSQ